MSYLRSLPHSVLLVSTLVLLLASCSKAPSPKVLATVGARQITIGDFRQEIERRHANRKPVPDKETLLQEMINYEALLQRATASGLAQDPRIKRELDNLLIAKFQEREIAPQVDAVNVTDEDVQVEYQRNLSKYTRPAKVRLALLRLETNPKMPEPRRVELRERLAEARRKILENLSSSPGSVIPGFGNLAIDYSDDQASRYRGGDIGWLDAGDFSYRWPRGVLETAYGSDKSQVSEVIETDNGFYLVMKTDSRDGAVTPLEQIKSALRQTLLAKKRREFEETERHNLIAQVHTTIDREALASVQIAVPAQVAAKTQESRLPGLPIVTETVHGN
jgi:parvulin-like peptidyl-prolyl isomerase